MTGERTELGREIETASLAGDVAQAFGKLGDNVAEVKPDNLAVAAAARWLALSPEERANAGLMAPRHGLRERSNDIVRERLGLGFGWRLQGTRAERFELRFEGARVETANDGGPEHRLGVKLTAKW